VLERGELQVSDMERKSEYDTLFRDVVQVLVDKCVNPATGRPYTAGVLERALRGCHVALDPKRSAKQQALDALPRLAKEFPITRARMRFRVAAPAAAADALRAALAEQGAQVEGEETRGGVLTGARLPCPRARACGALVCARTLAPTRRADPTRAGARAVTCVADPGSYRVFDAFTRGEACAGAGRLEVLSLAVVDDAAGGAAEFGAHASAEMRAGAAEEERRRRDAAAAAAPAAAAAGVGAAAPAAAQRAPQQQHAPRHGPSAAALPSHAVCVPA
jgi:ribosome maturation protein SDO1